MPAISIISTVLNEADAIDRLVETLSSQSLKPSEIVIVDGGSIDQTWEMLESFAEKNPLLRVIRDETCNLKNSGGPIARGRNVAIAAAKGEIIACADAGCAYGPEWLARLTAPIVSGAAEYALGGSCIDTSHATVWDLAAAPLMGISTSKQGKRQSCTARSMAFRRAVWSRAGGFPETSLYGEDSLFDLKVREFATPVFVESAMAEYAPRWTFASATKLLARYSSADGALGIRWSRFLRMSIRCLAQVAGLALLHWSAIPLVIDVLFELYYAFANDRTVLYVRGIRALVPRLIFSVLVPWISAWNYLAGVVLKTNRSNTQNQ